MAVGLTACNALPIGEDTQGAGTSTIEATDVETVNTQPPLGTGHPQLLHPTWTPRPPVPTQEVNAFVLDLLTSNGDCLLPCWWGILPGETTWPEASQFLDSFVTEIVLGGSGLVVRNGVEREEATYYLKYPVHPDGQTGGANLGVADGIVVQIYVGPASTSIRFRLHQILGEYGAPTMVFVLTTSSAPSPSLPFKLVLLHADRAIIAVFDTEARVVGDSLLGCPQDVTPSLITWDANEVWTETRIQEAVLGADPSTPLRRLEDISSIDSEGFYRLFRGGSAGQCIETPIGLW